MESPTVSLRVTCPVCLKLSSVSYSRLEITEMLSSSKPFLLYSPCHNRAWKATDMDRRALLDLIATRDYAADKQRHIERRAPDPLQAQLAQSLRI